MCVESARGVNLPLLTIYDFLGYDIDIKPQFDFIETDRALSNDYNLDFHPTELYIDYDDTIIIHDKVNEQIIALLYRCVNRNIPVYLVTKHDGDIIKSLKERRISPCLFRKIIHISQNEEKVDFIKPDSNALFIDDSFSERNKASSVFGIKTMGVDSVEVLLNGVKM